jgi:hypothetical protein
VEVDLYATNYNMSINGNWFVWTCRIVMTYKNTTGGVVYREEFIANTPHLNAVSYWCLMTSVWNRGPATTAHGSVEIKQEIDIQIQFQFWKYCGRSCHS